MTELRSRALDEPNTNSILSLSEFRTFGRKWQKK